MVGLSRMDHVGWVYWRPPRANPVQKDEHVVEKDGLTFGLVRDMVLENLGSELQGEFVNKKMGQGTCLPFCLKI